MSNMLENGAVLPFGLLGENQKAFMAGFNKSYNNNSLRVGVIKNSYPVGDDNNRSGLTTEYDVSVIEQNQDIGATSIVYKNCMALDGGGSIPDFFEKSFRTLKEKKSKGDGINLKGQNGAIVLLLCLDGSSDKGIIIGGFPHPDRKTTLTEEGPQLTGEFNGVNVAVNPDGSAAMTWKGPTDNDGKLIDSSQKSTVFNINKDGTVTILVATGTMVNFTDDGSIQLITKNGNSFFMNDKDGEISLTQKDGSLVGLSSTGVTISDSSGKQIMAINGSSVQLTSGGDIVEQSSSHAISSGAVTIKGAGGVKISDMVGGGLTIKNGQVALGGPTAEVLDLLSQTISQLNSLLTQLSISFSLPAVPFSPLNPAWSASAAPIQIQLTLISTLLSTIKGTI